MSESNKEKYGTLCNVLLTMHNIDDPSEADFKAFVNNPDSVHFLKNTVNHFINLWEKNKTMKSPPDTTEGVIQSGFYGGEDDNCTPSDVHGNNEPEISLPEQNPDQNKGQDKEKNNTELKPQPEASCSNIDATAKEQETNMPPSPFSVYFKLPNATCGKNYSSGFEIFLDFHSDKPTDTTKNNIEISSIKGLEPTGLTYDQDKQLISGIPAQSGEITLEILFKLKHTGESHRGNCLFIVNPNPRSLWKDKPSDKNDLFWKKDEDAQELITDNGWALVGVSKRGRSHAHEGKCRDDHFFISTDSSTKWNILAVADGAGSAYLSREGARIAVTESSTILCEKLKEYDSEITNLLLDKDCKKKLKDVLYNIFSLAVYQPVKVIHDTLNQQQDNGNLNFRDFHTTLLLTAHKEINGRHFIASYWIGDGGIALYHEDKFVKILGEGDSGEFAGQTRFLDHSAMNKDDIYKRIYFEYQESITALILMTDGITDPVFETDRNLNQLKSWDNFWKKTLKKQFSDKPGKTEQNLLDWLDFWSPGNHDDRTVALLFQKEINLNG